MTADIESARDKKQACWPLGTWWTMGPLIESREDPLGTRGGASYCVKLSAPARMSCDWSSLGPSHLPPDQALITSLTMFSGLTVASMTIGAQWRQDSKWPRLPFTTAWLVCSHVWLVGLNRCRRPAITGPRWLRGHSDYIVPWSPEQVTTGPGHTGLSRAPVNQRGPIDHRGFTNYRGPSEHGAQ